ncbi:hypothetical protein PAAG_04777 [Paracoccidioides lutzii Pb01]|uniref:Uncharacterized protein n=1 Tax=Paracoccidioides lutzii (strain ATCC MYA-826 / Pb01) TaxID=502779 RepID=C1H2E8_PARBA|nr:hypothetical protein PAAG_04777 [Paracoccidioides lutzii Pb01]EEH33728.2 hypothetical protein PAAG_04777 [Paracoccidioides lutzii Pb01]
MRDIGLGIRPNTRLTDPLLTQGEQEAMASNLDLCHAVFVLASNHFVNLLYPEGGLGYFETSSGFSSEPKVSEQPCFPKGFALTLTTGNNRTRVRATNCWTIPTEPILVPTLRDLQVLSSATFAYRILSHLADEPGYFIMPFNLKFTIIVYEGYKS